MRNSRINRRGFKLIEVVVSLGLACLIFALYLPGYIQIKSKARAAEVKGNLNNIQLSVERYAIDHEGAYPNYLTGGAAPAAGIKTALDPLLRGGYITAYPSNPFMRGKAGAATIARWQESLPSSQYGVDPLRPGSAEAELHGTRFGRNGGFMGSVLAEPRFGELRMRDAHSDTVRKIQSYSDVQYSFWDTQQTSKAGRYLPGEFFYKGAGPLIFAELVGMPSRLPSALDSEQAPLLPIEIDTYLLGAYGGLKDKGEDVLGPEQPFRSFGKPGPSYAAESSSAWPWTRSETSAAGRQGSPYATADYETQRRGQRFLFGNPNGIKDSVLILLSSGEDYISCCR